jgi:tyrosyl-tRNA synthetase
LSKEEIDELDQSVQAAPEKRAAQRKLAREVTAMLHGETELEKAVRASEVLFGKEISGLSVDQILDIFADVPSTEVDKSKFDADGFTLGDALVLSGLAPSKGEAKRLVQGGGVAMNNVRVDDARKSISAADFIDGQVLVLRKGAKHYHLIRIAS